MLVQTPLNVSIPDSIWTVGLVVLSGVFVLLYGLRLDNRYPLVNGSGWRDDKAKQRYLVGARSLIASGLKQWPVFNIVTENGRKMVLSPKYAEEIRSHPDLSFGLAIEREFHANVHGFEPFKQGTRADEILQDAIRMNLTQKLGSITQPLSDETDMVLRAHWTDNPDWHTIPLKPSLLKIVAQLSSKVFLGDEMCRNPDWLRITVTYTVDSFFAAEALRLYPKPLRPLVAPFLTTCKKVRRDLQESRDLIIPLLEKRRAEKQAAIERGEAPKQYNDAMEWMEQRAKGRPYDAASAQLSFSLAAIHTTSDMMTQLLFDVCGQEGLIDALREEIVTVIKQEGWQKTALYKLKLMDSAMKESQRLKPTSIVSMRRGAAKPITLSDGTFIPQGTITMISSERMWDETIYPDPETFDAYRFLKQRQMPGNETAAQFVSPSTEHFGFGLGKHACPGRFFASNEIKIALCHILLKYDVRLVEGVTPTHRVMGASVSSDPMAGVEIRRREAEIQL